MWEEFLETQVAHNQQCDVNYREMSRDTVWSYKFHRRINGRVPPVEVTRPYEKATIPTDLAIVHITLLVLESHIEEETDGEDLEGGDGVVGQLIAIGLHIRDSFGLQVPKTYTLHPTPYNLHPTPYPLHSTPYT